jgi:hypothetical protein
MFGYAIFNAFYYKIEQSEEQRRLEREETKRTLIRKVRLQLVFDWNMMIKCMRVVIF